MVIFNYRFIILISFLRFCKNWKYLFKLLLTLEVILISIITNLVLINTPINGVLFFLIVGVLSSVVGVTLLLISTRRFGNDNTYLFSA